MKRVRSIDLRPKAVRDMEAQSDHGFYNRAAWKNLRAAFLAENPLCVRCLKERDEAVVATIAHHIVERLVDPSRAYDPTNLEALCASCHSLHHGGPPRTRTLSRRRGG